MSSLRTLLALVLASAGLAAADIVLPGNPFDGNGGPLVAGNVYVGNGFPTVPAGQTLTVQAGAIVKVNGGRLIVAGTLDVNGTAGNEAIFTSMHDDVGGDSNGNGAGSVGGPGQWGGIEVLGSGTLDMDHALVRYHGAGGWSGVYVSGGSTVTVADSTIASGSTHGFDFNNVSGTYDISGCSITGNAGAAIEQIRLDDVPELHGNTASGNAGGDIVRVDAVTPSIDTTLTPDNGLADALVLYAFPTVPVGVTLRVEEGTILKVNGGRIIVAGTLEAAGTPSDPVVFTSFHDDDFGGDSNANGVGSVGGPGQWSGIELLSGSVSNIGHALVRYHGAGGWSGVYVSGGGATVTVTDSTIENGSTHGFDFNNSSGAYDISGCSITGNAGAAIEQIRLDDVPELHGNTASGNTGGDIVRVDAVTPAMDTTLTTDNGLTDTLVLYAFPTVPVGVTLRVEAGTILKANGGRIIVAGTLEAAGTSSDPVVFTSIHDDDFGGDSNANAAGSVGGPGQWSGIEVLGSGTLDMDHALVRYHGAGGWSGVYVSGGGATVTVTDSTIENGSTHGFDLNNSSGAYDISACSITGNAGAAIEQIRLDDVPELHGNTASGNTGGDIVRVDASSPTVDTTIKRDNGLADTLVLYSFPTISAGVTLRVEEGTILKVNGGRIIVDGTLDLAGTAHDPVVVTSFHDDGFGGDSNLNGDTTVAGPGQWNGIEIRSSATDSTLTHALVRCAGGGGWYGVSNAGTGTALRAVRVELNSSEGFRFSADTLADDVSAWSCATGLRLIGSASIVRRATVAGSSGLGIVSDAAFTGEIRSSLSTDNGGANWSGLANATVEYSGGLGVPAGIANQATDPMLVDVVNGNLRLQPGSPCIDAGDPGDLPGGQDSSTFPRLMDGDLNIVKRVDVGAYEFDNIELSMSERASPGDTLDVLAVGHADFTHVYLLVGVGFQEMDLKRFGTLFVDLFQPNAIFFWPMPPSSVPFEVPLSVPVGSMFVMQLGALVEPDPIQAGNLSNPVCVTIE